MQLAGKIRLRIITPRREKENIEVDMVIMRCTTGEMGILPGHAPCSAVLDFGSLRILEDKTERRMAVYGGIAQVKNDVVTVLANGADWPEDIDFAKASALRDEIEARIRERERDGHTSLQKDRAALRQALVQIEVSSYSNKN